MVPGVFPLKLGLSLPLNYLASGSGDLPVRCFAETFGPPAKGLACFKEHGVRSIEIQKFGANVCRARLRDAIKRVLDAGINLSLHGFLPPGDAQCHDNDTMAWLTTGLDAIGARQHQTVVVVHVLEAPGASRNDSVKITVQSLDRMATAIGTSGSDAVIAIEINRYRGAVTPGVTYEGLLRIVTRLRQARIGFCWDLGHTAFSVQQGKLPPNPPRDFIDRVIHTHLHGLSSQGETHWPIKKLTPHLTNGLRHLQRVGYRGVYNLELYPTRWKSTPTDVRHDILNSIDTLYTMPHRCPGAAGGNITAAPA